MVKNMGYGSDSASLCGKSTDVKPTDVKPYSTFFEYDTSKVYWFDADDKQWKELQ